MKVDQKQIHATIALGITSLVAGLFSHLALTDIFHGEGNLSMEWTVLRLSALVFLVFIGMAMYTLRKSLREVA